MNKALFLSTIFLLNIAYTECYELSQSDCDYWSQYCEWNNETGQCQEFGGGGGGGGGDAADGPYQYGSITESQGLRNGPDYLDGVLYYPIDAKLLIKVLFLPQVLAVEAEKCLVGQSFLLLMDL